jgi:hypothetical protein
MPTCEFAQLPPQLGASMLLRQHPPCGLGLAHQNVSTENSGLALNLTWSETLKTGKNHLQMVHLFTA